MKKFMESLHLQTQQGEYVHITITVFHLKYNPHYPEFRQGKLR